MYSMHIYVQYINNGSAVIAGTIVIRRKNYQIDRFPHHLPNCHFDTLINVLYMYYGNPQIPSIKKYIKISHKNTYNLITLT